MRYVLTIRAIGLEIKVLGQPGPHVQVEKDGYQS
jgi:hypothetical protein